MSAIIEKYQLGEIEVTVSESKSNNQYLILCQKGEEEFKFKAKKSEYKNYKRLMNRKIQSQFKS